MNYMNESLEHNPGTAKSYLRNPLSIIGLFATICYLVAGSAFSVGLDKLDTPSERQPFIWFLIIFPVVIFCVFAVFVWFKPKNLYAPYDFKDESNFIKLQEAESLLKVRDEAEKLLIDDQNTELHRPQELQGKQATKQEQSISMLMRKVNDSENMVINELGTMYNIKFRKDVRYYNSVFDAVGERAGITYIIECKYVESILPERRILETYGKMIRACRLLQNRRIKIIVAYVLEAYTQKTEHRIIEAFNSLDPDIDIRVFDYHKLRLKYAKVEGADKI